MKLLMRSDDFSLILSQLDLTLKKMIFYFIFTKLINLFIYQ